MIARPHLWELATAGQEGVAWVLECLRAEIDRAMALCGCETLANLDASLLHRSPMRPAVEGASVH